MSTLTQDPGTGGNASAPKSSVLEEKIQVYSPQPKAKLDALTSLRFFAAFTVAMLHIFGFLNISLDYPHSRLLTQGVSFFFVLSGFVLTYVYSDLHRPADISAFFLARFARIWPVHVTCLLIGLMVLPTMYWAEIFSTSGGILIAQLAMVQSWLLNPAWAMTLNAVAWSISVEWFFYLCFPFLIRRWRFGALAKLSIVAVLTAVIVICFAPLNTYYAFIFPPSRLLEFATGMAVCALWLNTRARIKWGLLWGSVAEASFFLLYFLYMGFEWQALNACSHIDFGGGTFSHRSLPAGVLDWFIHCGNGPIYAAMLYLMALEKGFISKGLKHPCLVWLGEISYSIYLLHFILVQYMGEHVVAIRQCNVWLIVIVYWLAAIGLAHLMFCLIERPCRIWLKSLPSGVPMRKDIAPSRLRDMILLGFAQGKVRSLGGIAAAVALLLFVCHQQIAAFEARAFTAKSPSAIRFGESSILQSVQIVPIGQQVKVSLTWNREKKSPSKEFVALHLIGDSGQLITSSDYATPIWWNFCPDPTSRNDDFRFAMQDFKRAKAIGVLMYRETQNNLLKVDKGDRDWQDSRLLIACPELSSWQ